MNIETRMSRRTPWGTGRPGFWREFTLDMIMTLHESDKWGEDDNRDEEAVGKLNVEKNMEYSEDKLSREQLSFLN